MIVGIKTLTGKKRQINLVTPFTTYDEMDYPGADELEDKVNTLCVEIREYVLNQKSGGNPQVEIEFPHASYEDYKAKVMQEAVVHPDLHGKELDEETMKEGYDNKLTPEETCKKLIEGEMA